MKIKMTEFISKIKMLVDIVFNSVKYWKEEIWDREFHNCYIDEDKHE